LAVPAVASAIPAPATSASPLTFRRLKRRSAGGAKKYVPREYDKSVDGLVNFFSHVINEIGLWTMRLGFHRTQDLVGRSDLMKQTRGNEIDRPLLSALGG
jgi:glutamate synthase (NADPH/NADH) large chain